MRAWALDTPAARRARHAALPPRTLIGQLLVGSCLSGARRGRSPHGTRLNRRRWTRCRIVLGDSSGLVSANSRHRARERAEPGGDRGDQAQGLLRPRAGERSNGLCDELRPFVAPFRRPERVARPRADQSEVRASASPTARSRSTAACFASPRRRAAPARTRVDIAAVQGIASRSTKRVSCSARASSSAREAGSISAVAIAARARMFFA